MHPIPSTVETATVMNSTTALDDSLSSVYHSPPTPLPYDADPRYFRFVKGSGHSGEESEPLRGDTEMSSEALVGGGTKWSKSDSDDGSKEVYSKGSSTIAKSKTMPGVEIYYADSDDEDICPTCLDGKIHFEPTICRFFGLLPHDKECVRLLVDLYNLLSLLYWFHFFI